MSKSGRGRFGARKMMLVVPGVVLMTGLSACASAPPKTDVADYQAYEAVNDPLEPTNREFYKVNDTLDTYVMKPVAEGYVDVTNQTIRNHVGDFVSNIGEPARTVNFILEGMPRDACVSLMRFIVNSSFGIGGIFDLAKHMHLPETDTDFGITLAIWGLPAGPYLYLPVFGPSGARDVWNLPYEYFATPMELAPASAALSDFGYAETGLHLINTRAELLDTIDQIKATALDPYATFRSLYRQSRASEVVQVYEAEGRTPPTWAMPPSN
ncbi:VacJ family lipoprotein [Acidocella sp.]|uniref:MlaA family lipoprotein n=1 Tax=Acidocella sp. TaxID=50710 RepID=UPI002637ADF1|nr:VacJ family lipoprotein [Acidocella sp.]